MKTNKYKKNTKRLSKEPHKKTRYLRKKNTKRISKKPHKKTRYNKFTKKYKGGNAIAKRRKLSSGDTTTARRKLSFGDTPPNSQSPLPHAKRQVPVFKDNTFEHILLGQNKTFKIHEISKLEILYNNLEDLLLGQEIKYYGKIESYNVKLKGQIHEFMNGTNADYSIQLYYRTLKSLQNKKYDEQFMRTQDRLESCKAAAAISKLEVRRDRRDPYDSQEYRENMDNFYNIEMIIELLKITIKLYRVLIKYFFFKNKEKSDIQFYLDEITRATGEEKPSKILHVLNISLDFFSLNDPYDESSYPNEKDEIYLGTNIYTYNTKLPSIENYINYLSANILILLGPNYNLNIISEICNPTNFIHVLYAELEREIGSPLR